MKYEIGIRLSWSEKKDYFLISFPSRSLRFLVGHQIFDFLKAIPSLGFSPSRIDCALDFPDGMGACIGIDAIWGWCLQGFLAGGRKSALYSGNPQFCPQDFFWEYGEEAYRKISRYKQLSGGSKARARTIYIGSRGKKGAGYFSRIYEKGKQYGFSSPWLRVETEFSGKRAKQVLNGLLAALLSDGASAALELIASFALYRISFKSNSKYSNGSGRQTLSRWETAIAGIIAVSLPPRHSGSGNFPKIRAFIHQYSKFLARIHRAAPAGFLKIINFTLAEGYKKLKQDGLSAPSAVFIGSSCSLELAS
jgi:hypothetical protein